MYAVALVLRHGVFERRRSHVPHSAERPFRTGPCPVLRGRNRFGIEIPPQKRHRLQVPPSIYHQFITNDIDIDIQINEDYRFKIEDIYKNESEQYVLYIMSTISTSPLK